MIMRCLLDVDAGQIYLSFEIDSALEKSNTIRAKEIAFRAYVNI